MVVISLFSLVLMGCLNTSRPNHPLIAESVVSLSNVLNSDVEVMHFNVSIEDYGLGPEQQLSIRILIQDPTISNLINTEVMESADTWKTLSESSGGVFAVSFTDR